MDFDTFWSTYPVDLCSRKGSKKEAIKSWDKIMKGLSDEESADMVNKIIIGLREWLRHDRREKKTGAFVPRWPHASTWLNQERYSLEDIPMTGDKLVIEVSKCQCGSPATYVNQCEACYERDNPDPWAATRKAELIRLGLVKPGQGKREVIAACKEHLKETGLLARTLGGRA